MIRPTVIPAICAIFSIFSAFSSPAVSDAECDRVCLKSRLVSNARVLGIISSKEYLLRRQRVLLKTQKAAKLKGYTKRALCSGSSGVALAARCNYPVGIRIDKTYACLNDLRTFRRVATAKKRGYQPVSACPSPSPSPSPTITPLPQSLTFDSEPGIRHTDIAVSSTLRLGSGTFRAYLGRSIYSFDQKNIAYADSDDGLTFSAPLNITGVTLDASQTLTYPSFFLLQNGNYGLVYESVKHISSAGVDIHTLNMMTSANGAAFTKDPAGPFDSNISSTFAPSVVRIDDSLLRLYYRDLGPMGTSVSHDEGVSWTPDAAGFIIHGSSESFAYYPRTFSVIKLGDGTYRMFFSAYPASTSNVSRLYTAVSTDAKTFQVEAGTLVEPEVSTYALDRPDAVLLADGKIRVYFAEYYEEQNTRFKNIRSVISR